MERKERKTIRMELRVKVKQGNSRQRSDRKRKEASSSLLSTLPYDLALSSSPSAVCNCLSSCVRTCVIIKMYRTIKA